MADPLYTLWAMTATDGGYHHVEWRNGGPWHGYDVPVGDPRRFMQCVSRLSDAHDVLVSAAPRPRPGFGSADQARCLWARTETQKQRARLKAFRPRPTLCLQEGDSCRLVALWALSEMLSYEWLLRANRRLAHALGTPKKYAAAEFMLPAPGSCLRHGRRHPILVREWVNPRLPIYTAGEVVGRLKDAPDPDAWRKAAA